MNKALEQINMLQTKIMRLQTLCRMAADELQNQWGDPDDPLVERVERPVHQLIRELREA